MADAELTQDYELGIELFGCQQNKKNNEYYENDVYYYWKTMQKNMRAIEPVYLVVQMRQLILE
jgi:hypothetical protein